MAAELARRPGASKYFIGSVVSYHREIKNKILRVPLPLLQSLGEVSVPVAKMMAHGVRNEFAVDWAIAITGVAGPTGGSVEKPVGTVCFSIVGPGHELHIQKKFGPLSRREIQDLSVSFSLDLLYDALKT